MKPFVKRPDPKKKLKRKACAAQVVWLPVAMGNPPPSGKSHLFIKIGMENEAKQLVRYPIHWEPHHWTLQSSHKLTSQGNVWKSCTQHLQCSCSKLGTWWWEGARCGVCSATFWRHHGWWRMSRWWTSPHLFLRRPPLLGSFERLLVPCLLRMNQKGKHGVYGSAMWNMS